MIIALKDAIKRYQRMLNALVDKDSEEAKTLESVINVFKETVTTMEKENSK